MELKDYCCLDCDWYISKTKYNFHGCKCPKCNQCSVVAGTREPRTTNPFSALNVSVDMDTDQLQRKLRVIAKHCESLAYELDLIDKTATKG